MFVSDTRLSPHLHQLPQKARSFERAFLKARSLRLKGFKLYQNPNEAHCESNCRRKVAGCLLKFTPGDLSCLEYS